MAILPAKISRAFSIGLPRTFHGKRSGSYTVSSTLSGVRNADASATRSDRAASPLKQLARTLFYGDRAERRGLHPEVRTKLDAMERSGRAEKVTLTSSDGRQLRGYFHHAVAPDTGEPAPGNKTVLFLHGTGSRAEHQSLPFAAAYPEHGCDVLAVNIGGFGESEGSPSEATHIADAFAMVRHLVDGRGIPPHQIVVHGLEMGGPIATKLARLMESNGEPLGGVILDRTLWNSDRPSGGWHVPGLGRFAPFRDAVNKQVGRYSLESDLEGLSTPVVGMGSLGTGKKIGASIDRIFNVVFVDNAADFNARHRERYEGTMTRFTGLALRELDRTSADAWVAGMRDRGVASVAGETFTDHGVQWWAGTTSAPEDFTIARPRHAEASATNDRQRAEADALREYAERLRRVSEGRSTSTDSTQVQQVAVDQTDGVLESIDDGPPYYVRVNDTPEIEWTMEAKVVRTARTRRDDAERFTTVLKEMEI